MAYSDVDRLDWEEYMLESGFSYIRHSYGLIGSGWYCIKKGPYIQSSGDTLRKAFDGLLSEDSWEESQNLSRDDTKIVNWVDNSIVGENHGNMVQSALVSGWYEIRNNYGSLLGTGLDLRDAYDDAGA